MPTATLLPPTMRTAPEPASQLAADLGHVLETLLDQTAHGLLHRFAVHGITPIHARILRHLDRSLAAPTAVQLAAQLDLDPVDVEQVAGDLHRRDLVIHRGDGGGLALTRHGRAVIHDVEQARRTDLRSYVDGLDATGRRRLEAALCLLDGRI